MRGVVRNGALAAALTLLSLPLLWLGAARADETATALVGTPNFWTGHPTFADADTIHVVVEIPAGTNAKWEVAAEGRRLEWERRHGRGRVVQYLAYPANYGMVPRTLLPAERGGDGDPLDVILLGSAVDRGRVLAARPIGMLEMLDGGERDDKIVAVPLQGPLSDATDLATLRERYPGVDRILETWFTSYKGPGRIEASGWGDRAEALTAVREATRFYAERRGGAR